MANYKEYIVLFVNEEAADQFDRYHGLEEEVIRCKDCCHYPSEHADCPMIGWARNENDYCSKAERREE